MEETEKYILFAIVLLQAILDVIAFTRLDTLTSSLALAWVDISQMWCLI